MSPPELDPSEPARYARVVWAVLIGYMVYSLAIGLCVWRSRVASERQRAAIHGLDLAFGVVLAYFSRYPPAPVVSTRAYNPGIHRRCL